MLVKLQNKIMMINKSVISCSTAPARRPNKIIDSSREDKVGEMNPYARTRKQSMIVREAVRSGAADGTPYYGSRKSGVWIPNAPGV